MENAREKRLLEQQKTDIQNVMSSESGRRLIWRLLSYCGVYQDIESNDLGPMAKQIGKRKVGLYLLGIVSDIDEDRVFTMMQEAKEASMQERFEIDQEEIARDIRDLQDNYRSNPVEDIDTII